ncbi:MAG: hypothetical protein K5770_14055 [Lachnospiraceae bacterium]|nr:hypothetical protein [Lachnospiraceae bacterium]
MYDTFTKIEIGGGNHPIKCNIEVMAALQDKFGSLNAFEKAIIGLQDVYDDDGKPKRDEEGKQLFIAGEPSIKAILEALPIMLKAGYDDAIEQGEASERPDLRRAIKEADFNYIKVANAIHDEFKRCYERKNRTTPPKRGGKARKA